MIDVVNLSDYTTIECDLEDLPSFISERVKSHLMLDETPYICIGTRVVMGFEVYITTYNRVIKSTVQIHGKKLNFDSENKTTSIVFSEIFGLAHKEYRENRPFYDLNVLAHSLELSFTFGNKELFSKFASRIVASLAKRQ